MLSLWDSIRERPLRSAAIGLGLAALVGGGYALYSALTEEKSAFQKRAGSGGVTFESQPAAAMQHIVDAIRACGAEGVFLEEDALRLDKEFRAHSKPSKMDPTKRVLTADGFRQVCSRMGLHEPRLVDHLFKQWDSDGSGEIDFQEFMHAITFVRTGSSADKIVILFRIMDVDDDGCVSRVELARFLTSVYRAAGKPKPPSKIQEQVDKLFGHLDKDHSENISLEEFRHASHSFKVVTGETLAELLDAMTKQFTLSLASEKDSDSPALPASERLSLTPRSSLDAGLPATGGGAGGAASSSSSSTSSSSSVTAKEEDADSALPPPAAVPLRRAVSAM